jgi:PAS domain S-box-containing protein
MQRSEYESWKPLEVARLLALVESERRYFQELLAKLPVAIAVVSASGELRAANRAFRDTFGLAADAVARTSVDSLFAEAPVRDWIHEVARTGASLGDCEVLTGEGDSARHFVLRLDPAPEWAHAERREVLLTVLESTPLREAETEQRPGAAQEAPAPDARDVGGQAQRAKRAALERLAARVTEVAGELLAAIDSHGEELLQSLPEDDVRRAGLAGILRAAGRLRHIMEDLRGLAEARQYPVEVLDLRSWLEARRADWAQWCVDVELPEPGLCALVPAELLEQILVDAAHFLSLALGPSTRLRLRAAACGSGRIQVRIEWPPASLDGEARERFFEPFPSGRVGPDAPVGVGAHVRSWESTGGRMFLEGDVFVLDCPSAPIPAARPSLVLLVEQDAGIRSLVARALERAGFRVVQAGSAQEALEAWEAHGAAPRVLITDLTLPGVSGRELADRLRMRFPDLRVLFISGYTEDQALAAVAASGSLAPSTRLLHKPFTTARLVEEVRALAGS